VNANCRRDNRSADKSIGVFLGFDNHLHRAIKCRLRARQTRDDDRLKKHLPFHADIRRPGVLGASWPGYRQTLF
jgi:hypothetical protein